MLAYRQGDAAAFESLYGRHKGPLFRFVLRAVKERALAEELYQEIWIRVIEARARYMVQAKFTTWLYTIAHHRLADHWRKRGLKLVDAVEADDPPAPRAFEPEARAEGRQDLQRLAAALAALPAAQREAFLLHEEAGMSVGEIAAATGATAEAAKSRLRYAHAKLREALDDD
ncbi:MAG TPA: sigma-70 family RNA polymerase sigma factor [Burkholderiales bacterium]|jgi:RNA polymerase sigma-70 factor (ECF subfamily)|nr:sigma-70 family RNA polymerase sigma factor [Burkholderiales bacterium]